MPHFAESLFTHVAWATLALQTNCGLYVSDAITQSSGLLAANPAPNRGSIVLVEDRESGSYCSGTLISPVLVLTARHCVQPMRGPPRAPTALSVRVVSDGLVAVSAGTVHEVASVYVERTPWLTDAELSGRDTAVLRLRAPAEVRSIEVAVDDCAVQVHSSYVAVGFGLNETRVGLVRRESVVTVFGARESVISTDPNGCIGDSGGPLLNGQGLVIAVLSRSGCGVGEAQYTHVCAARTLIQSALCEESPDASICRVAHSPFDGAVSDASASGSDDAGALRATDGPVFGTEHRASASCTVVRFDRVPRRPPVTPTLIFCALCTKRKRRRKEGQSRRACPGHAGEVTRVIDA